MTVPTIAVKESRAALLEIGPSTGLPGGIYGLVYALEKGLYVWKTGDQSSNVPANNDSDEWIAPSEDTSGKSGAWKRIVKERPEMSVIYHPEEATDSGTDQYGSEETTSPPSPDAVIARDFQSANSTTTPTLDGKTMTTRDGSALWASAVSGVHELQYDSGADTYLVLEPLPIDEDDMASDSAAAVPTQQSVKAYVDAGDPTLDTVVDATNGGNNDLTEIDFTGIKAGAKRITILFSGLSPSGSDDILVQIGDSGGLETSGYLAQSGSSSGTSQSTSGFIVLAGASGVRLRGAMVIHLVDGTTWISDHSVGRTNASFTAVTGGGGKTLSAELDRLRITLTGSDTFDDGDVNILVE